MAVAGTLDYIIQMLYKGQGGQQAKRGMSDVRGEAKKTKLSMTELNQGLQLVQAGYGKVAGVINESVELYKIQESAEKQLEQTVSSTGMAAGLTADELKKMASGLQEVTTFGDEAVIGGQSLLLTFTNIGKDVFPRTTETMLDMSQALGQDLKSSAIQLGKALNDPIAGVSALSRVGVSFTAEQKEMIRTMVEMNDVAGAQNLILDELSREFGGQARAAAETYTGALQQQQNILGDYQEQLGGAIIPLQVQFTKAMVDFLAPASEAVTYMTQLSQHADALAKQNMEAAQTTGDWASEGHKLTKILEENDDILFKMFGRDKILPQMQEIAAMTGDFSGTNEELAASLEEVYGAEVRIAGNRVYVGETLIANINLLRDINEEYRIEQGILEAVSADQKFFAQAVDETNPPLEWTNDLMMMYGERGMAAAAASAEFGNTLANNVNPVASESGGLIQAINDQLARMGNRHDFLLKMDVEGLEKLKQAVSLASQLQGAAHPDPYNQSGGKGNTTYDADQLGSAGNVPGEGPQSSTPTYGSSSPTSNSRPDEQYYSHGGRVYGGIQGRDSVPARLMPGERVLTTAQNREWERGMRGGAGSGGGISIQGDVNIIAQPGQDGRQLYYEFKAEAGREANHRRRVR